MSEAVKPTAVSKKSINQACSWLARLWADDVSEKDRAACLAWRQASTENEAAWQQVQQIQQRFHALPDPQAGSTLLKQQKAVSRREFLSIAGAGGIGAGLLTMGILRPDIFSAVDYATNIGEIHDVVLADGTHLIINTVTRVDIAINQQRREILLHEGEIYIETAPHALPLIVVSKAGVLRPLGTRFTVRHTGNDKQTTLAVYQGRVQVQPTQTERTTIIEAGNAVGFTQHSLLKTYTAEASNLAWISHKLAVANMPLIDFIDELSRYRSGVLQVSAELAALAVTGVFSLRDTDRVLNQLTEILPVRLQSFTPFWIRILPVR